MKSQLLFSKLSLFSSTLECVYQEHGNVNTMVVGLQQLLPSSPCLPACTWGGGSCSAALIHCRKDCSSPCCHPTRFQREQRETSLSLRPRADTRPRAGAPLGVFPSSCLTAHPTFSPDKSHRHRSVWTKTAFFCLQHLSTFPRRKTKRIGAFTDLSLAALSLQLFLRVAVQVWLCWV